LPGCGIPVQGAHPLRDDAPVRSRSAAAAALAATCVALTGCHAATSDQGADPGTQVPPTPTGRFRCPSTSFVSNAVGFEVEAGQGPHVGCLYNDVDDPDAHWVSIAHERDRYRGHTLAGVASEIVTTMRLQGLGLITPFPEGGPQAFRFGSPPTSCQYWVYVSDAVPSGVDSIDRHAEDCESARRLAAAIALH
jgi:hypothetical protein